jgi:hypothetical protein
MIIYGDSTRIYRQPGRSTLKVSKDSVATATEEYRGVYAVVVAQSPRIDDVHPDFPGLLVTDKTITNDKGIGIAQVQYKGLDPAQNPNALPPPIYELDVSLNQEPIATHPDFDDIIDAAGGEGEGKAVFSEDGVFVGFGKDSGANLVGVTEFLDATARWTKRYLSLSAPTGAGNVGKISSPEGPNPTYAGRNWLYAGLSYSRQGGIYQITKVWLLSGRGGWNTEIYG